MINWTSQVSMPDAETINRRFAGFYRELPDMEVFLLLFFIFTAFVVLITLFASPLATAFSMFIHRGTILRRSGADVFAAGPGAGGNQLTRDNQVLHNTSTGAMSSPTTWPYVRARGNDVFNGLLALIALTRSRPGYIAA